VDNFQVDEEKCDNEIKNIVPLQVETLVGSNYERAASYRASHYTDAPSLYPNHNYD
jgi:hypothetical protein